MHIHRSVRTRSFTVLPNEIVQGRSFLTVNARVILQDLLSRPDGWREDARQIADTTLGIGRTAVRRALKELADAGYYRVDTVRLPDGTLRSESHVFDKPWFDAPPSDPPPEAGEPDSGPPDTPPVKNPEEVPTLPAEELTPPPDPQVQEAVAALYRVIRREPRLRLGEREALALAPLVAEWLARGATEADLTEALVPGLPQPVHSPVGILRSRLERKLPPPGRPAAAPPPRTECRECRAPVPSPGICRPCAGLVPRRPVPDPATARTGAAIARTALLAARRLTLRPAC
ncbi:MULTISPECIES: hypothetical protein [unclassified Kitasatospora]|uniref:hypothetical protein n=1 Tax=unclassified Kitasatospora TaxID=2633591 RepID=UPI0033F6ADB8